MVCVAGLTCVAMTGLAAEDYVLAVGDADTIALADGATTNLASVTVAGDLTINGDGWIKTATINLDGGTITVDGTKASIGSAHSSNDTPTTLTVTNSADGTYGKVTVRNGTTTGPIKDNRFNFSAKFFKVATNAADVTGTDGVVDVLSVENASVSMRRFENYSSLTGRIAVSGTSWLMKGGGYSYGEGVFVKGSTVIDLQDGAQLSFSVGNQLGTFNSAGASTIVTGTGDLIFRQSYNMSQGNYQMVFQKGAVLNNAGNVYFCGAWGAGFFSVRDNDVIGPNVATISPLGSDRITLCVPTPYIITVRDIDFVRNGYSDKLVGDGAIRVDASSAVRTFRANIPPAYEHVASWVTNTYENLLTIEKVGANELTMASTTNIPTLKVLEGPVRITSDCVISNLFGATGATLIADGCTVSFTGEAILNGLELETANGGSFVKAGGGRMAAYDPGTIDGPLHVAAGSLVFSQYGFTNKYWRWTFTKVYNGPKPLHLGRFWVFGTDGEHAAKDLGYKSTNETLTAGTCRWRVDPSTNVAIDASTIYWQGESYVRACFRTYFTSGMNNFANLMSPVIDPDNPASYLALELRLKDSAKPVTGYNIATALGNDYPMSWTVEASDDGETWTSIETRTDEVHKNPLIYYFFDGESANGASSVVNIRGKPREYFHFTGYRNDGLAALSEPLSVQVDDGAMLDLRAFTEGQPIGSLTIDMDTGGGTIYGGSAAAGGTLALTNAAASGRDILSPLPLVLDGISGTGNLSSWTVTVDGVERKFRVAMVNGSLCLQPTGTFIIVR